MRQHIRIHDTEGSIGHLTYEEDFYAVKIVELRVEPYYRNQGYARKLIHQLLEKTKKSVEVRAIPSEPEVSFNGIARLLKSFGFMQVKKFRWRLVRR